MKQKTILLFLLSVISFSVSAQKSSSNKQNTVAAKVASETKMNTTNENDELHTQLTTLFGKSYSVKDAKVIAQLQKNISDKNASERIRKSSLFAIYGNDYINHLDKISSSNSPNSTK